MVEPSLTAVVMVKQPAPGAVKSRLVNAGMLDARAAADLARAMLRATVERLAPRFRLLLAVSPDGVAPALARSLGRGDLPVIDQGAGDLGARLDRIWRAVAPAGPIAFFGGDSPDVPAAALEAIAPSLADADLALGPTEDGGYWTLAARRHLPQVLAEIDWGTDRVYDQTCRRAREAGLVLRELPRWPDVDLPDDVTSLRSRLAGLPPGLLDQDAALQELAETLSKLLEAGESSGTKTHERTRRARHGGG